MEYMTTIQFDRWTSTQAFGKADVTKVVRILKDIGRPVPFGQA